MVEAVRIGTVVAQDRKALQRWQSHRRRAAQPQGEAAAGLTGLALERVVMGLARSHPDLVALRG